MSIVAIGSLAANFWHPEIWDSPKDEDYIARFEDFRRWIDIQQGMGLIEACFPAEDGKKFYIKRVAGPPVEVEIAYAGDSADELIKRMDADTKDGFTYYPTMDWLFALKASHRYLKDSPHFEKTINDYHSMKELGCSIPDAEWFKQREEETYNKPRPNLNRSKDDFFVKDAGVQYIYDHDTIHLAMAEGDQPAYKSYQADGAQVMVSKKKWDECPKLTKLNGVLEETYVLALERSQIPYRGLINPKESFNIALSKVCTSITSGWFREFAYENYFDVLSMYNPRYLEKFDQALEEGIVKKVDANKAIATM